MDGKKENSVPSERLGVDTHVGSVSLINGLSTFVGYLRPNQLLSNP